MFPVALSLFAQSCLSWPITGAQLVGDGTNVVFCCLLKVKQGK